MDETLFKTLSDQLLTDLSDSIEASDIKGEFDVEYQSGILTVTLPSKRQYVVNQHTPMRQIWLSSPVSGAFHFDYKNGEWIGTRGGENLVTLLKSELKF